MGFARSDPSHSIAFSLQTLIGPKGQQLMNRDGLHPALSERFQQLWREEPFSAVVLGWPLRTDGSPGELIRWIEPLADWLRHAFPVPVIPWDEFGTSADAIDRLEAAPRSVRRRPGQVDRMAAQLILQSALDAAAREGSA